MTPSLCNSPHPCLDRQVRDMVKRVLPSCCFEMISVNYSSSHRRFFSLLVNYICSHHCDAGNKMLLSTFAFSGTPSWLLSTGSQTLLESISFPNFLHTSKTPSSRITLVSMTAAKCAREFVCLEGEEFCHSLIILLWPLFRWHQGLLLISLRWLVRWI